MPAKNAHDGGEHQNQAHHCSRKVHREYSVQDDEMVVIRQLREAVVETGGEEEPESGTQSERRTRRSAGALGQSNLKMPKTWRTCSVDRRWRSIGT